MFLKMLLLFVSHTLMNAYFKPNGVSFFTVALQVSYYHAYVTDEWTEVYESLNRLRLHSKLAAKPEFNLS